MRSISWPSSEQLRHRLYRITQAVVPLLQVYGIVQEQTAALWVGLAAAVLGVSMAASNTTSS